MITIEEMKLKAPVRFWSKIKFDADLNKCWDWTGCMSGSGYGCVVVKCKTLSAHRVAAKYFIDNPTNLPCVCHSCDNRRCVNPNHLWYGTHSQNAIDMVKKGRGNRPIGINQKRSKLNNEKILDIVSSWRIGLSLPELAEKFKVNKTTIHNILHRKTWVHVDVGYSEEELSTLAINHQNKTSVIQYRLDGSIVAKYETITLAAKHIGGHHSQLSKSLRLGNGAYKGFLFKVEHVIKDYFPQ